MYQVKGNEDTIAAISTSLGAGGIGMVRVSGREALSIADRIFINRKHTAPSSFPSHTVHHGWIVKRGASEEQIIDEVLLTVMRSPNSYTKEDIIEISAHGGLIAVRSILQLVLESGARLAEAGEFTKRAFLNGRIDLTQAEAVLDIISAKTDAFLRVSTHQLKGELSRELESIREQLLAVHTEMEAIVNFPEDDIDASGRRQLEEKILAADERIERLLRTAQEGRLLKEGIRIVLCGKPNVGKSSLLNVLLKTPRAIVSEIAGTTRDSIEEPAQIRGIPFQLVDTAGILEPRDFIEAEAVKRSRLHIEGADLALLVLDASAPLSPEDAALLEQVRDRNHLIVLNKCDRTVRLPEEQFKKESGETRLVRVSALRESGIAELEEAIVRNVLAGRELNADGLLVSNLRHIRCLQEGSLALTRALAGLKEGLSLEFPSEEIKAAVNALDAVTGRNIDADLLEKIFSDFCIGK